MGDRVVIMTFSEFGRRPEANDGAGTDHGTANVVFVVGDHVKGGLYGQQPSLAASGLDEYGNLVHHVDFRSVYASIVSRWFGADEREVARLAFPAARPVPRRPRNRAGVGWIRFGGVGTGYWIATATGAVANAGHAPHQAPLGALALVRSSVATSPRRSTGSGSSHPTAASSRSATPSFHGSTGAMHLNRPIVGMAATPTGHGYWLVASDGGIFSFGDASFHGSTGAMHLNRPIVGMAATPTGHGYWLVASDGGIFCFGDASFHGSTGAIHLNQPIVGMAATPSRHGYWLVASDGGIFGFGDASFHGSAVGSIAAPARALRRDRVGTRLLDPRRRRDGARVRRRAELRQRPRTAGAVALLPCQRVKHGHSPTTGSRTEASGDAGEPSRSPRETMRSERRAGDDPSAWPRTQVGPQGEVRARHTGLDERPRALRVDVAGHPSGQRPHVGEDAALERIDLRRDVEADLHVAVRDGRQGRAVRVGCGVYAITATPVCPIPQTLKCSRRAASTTAAICADGVSVCVQYGHSWAIIATTAIATSTATAGRRATASAATIPSAGTNHTT